MRRNYTPHLAVLAVLAMRVKTPLFMVMSSYQANQLGTASPLVYAAVVHIDNRCLLLRLIQKADNYYASVLQ